MVDKNLLAQFNLAQLPPEFYQNPYPFYQALRADQAIKPMSDGSYFLTRYEDIQSVYKNPKLFSSDKQREFKPKYGASALYEHHTTSLVFNDPPLHTRVRKLIAGALHPKALENLEPGLIQCVQGLLDKMQGKTQVDLIEDYAMHIPIEIIGNLLGIPHEEREPLRAWSLAILGALEPKLSPEMFAAGNRAVSEFLLYLEDLIARRRNEPGDPEKDVLTRLMQGEAGESLSHQELLHNCIFLLNAGHETTTNLIGNSLYTLLEHPEQKQLLLEHPELIHSAVEEFLRFESSNQLGNRISTAPTELNGVHLPAQTQITLCIGAANRDPERFPEPDRLDIQRTPNRHLAFGSGIHQCVGLNLARMEGRIAIGHFLQRYPQYHLAAPATRGGRARFRGFLNIPCYLNPTNNGEATA
ncbi:MAG: cytochrome P450 [Thiothrix sp.]|nr:MAG: cytochrome P450 [Thiothrix sp.]